MQKSLGSSQAFCFDKRQDRPIEEKSDQLLKKLPMFCYNSPTDINEKILCLSDLFSGRGRGCLQF